MSGGHTHADRGERHRRVQAARRDPIDDAAGEAFDKTAKLLGLPYPGGPHLARLAAQGRRGAFSFPRPMLDRPGLEFSFSGPQDRRAAVREACGGRARGCALARPARAGADIALEVQAAIVETLVAKALRALEATGLDALVVAGGVGANRALRERARCAAARRAACACTIRASNSAPTMRR